MKPVGKPDAANPHVRFDERGRETEQRHRARPRLYQDKDTPSGKCQNPQLLQLLTRKLRSGYEKTVCFWRVFACTA